MKFHQVSTHKGLVTLRHWTGRQPEDGELRAVVSFRVNQIVAVTCNWATSEILVSMNGMMRDLTIEFSDDPDGSRQGDVRDMFDELMEVN
jgi:hypothetical protein